MPNPISEWELALTNTKVPTRSIKEKQHAHDVKLTLFPPPDLILDSEPTKRRNYIYTWLGSRKGLKWVQSQNPNPLPYKFWKELLATGFALGGDAPVINGTRKQKLQRTLQHHNLDFTDGGALCLKDSRYHVSPLSGVTGVTWLGHHIPEHQQTRLPGGSLVAEMLWEITWLNFRGDVMRLDQVAYRNSTPQGRRDVNDLEARYQMLYSIFHDWEYTGKQDWAYISPFPQADFGLIHQDINVRAKFIRRFATVQSQWSYPTSDTIARWINQPDSVSTAQLEAAVYLQFCQCFADHFYMLPCVPRHVPSFSVYT